MHHTSSRLRNLELVLKFPALQYCMNYISTPHDSEGFTVSLPILIVWDIDTAKAHYSLCHDDMLICYFETIQGGTPYKAIASHLLTT
jgi:hypothetical protein